VETFEFEIGSLLYRGVGQK